MKNIRQDHEDRTVLALLYDDYRRIYPKSMEVMRCEIESLYHQMHRQDLTNAEEVTTVCLAICGDEARYAYEAGVKLGVRLAMDLELDSSLH